MQNEKCEGCTWEDRNTDQYPCKVCSNECYYAPQWNMQAALAAYRKFLDEQCKTNNL